MNITLIGTAVVAVASPHAPALGRRVVRADMKGSFREADPTDADDMSLQEKLDRLDALMNDPELRQHARDHASEQE